MEDIREVFAVLLPEGAVEVIAGEEFFFDGGRQFSFSGKRASWGETNEEEGEGDDAEQHRGHGEEASGEKGKHEEGG